MKKIILLICILLPQFIFAQRIGSNLNSGFVRNPSDTLQNPSKWYQSKAFKIVAPPLILIGYGVSTIEDNGLFLSSKDVQEWRQKNFPGFKTGIDDYLPSVPVAIVYGLNMIGAKGQNDFVNRTIIFGIANAMSGFITDRLKEITHIQRPDGSGYTSFPSAHTTAAFLAAEFMHQEYKNKNVWLSIAGYPIAASVAVLRVLNNKHWMSDVFASAGIGILSVKITYLIYSWVQTKVCEGKNKNIRF